MAESETGWTKEWPAIGGVYWYRLDAKALSDIVEVRDGDVYYAGDEVGVSVRNHDGGEWLGPLSPSDAEQLVGLRRAATEAMKVLKLEFPGSIKRKAAIAQLETAIRGKD